MDLSTVTPLVLTWNEASNIGRCLERLQWAKEVVVVDSGSTDETKSICEGYSNVRFITHPFESHSIQWNFGIAQITTPWILAMDADFNVSQDLPEEIKRLPVDDKSVAYQSRFQYLIFGHALRGTLYPPRTTLFRKEFCHYIQDGHTQLLSGDQPRGHLKTTIDHDDRKSLSRWLDSQLKYARLEADKLETSPPSELGFNDRIRQKIWLAPLLTPVYTLLVKGVIFDGWSGLYYAFQRTYAELLLSLELLDRKLRR